MAYNKTTWVDFETKLTAANLNKIENGLADASAKADNATNTINSWGASTGPVGKVPGLVEDVQDHNTRLNTIELDLYAENDGIEDRLDVAEGDIDDLETEVATIKQSHGSTLSTIESVLSGHLSDKSNPHKVTPAQLGVYTQSEVDTRLSAGFLTAHLDLASSSYDTVTAQDMCVGEQRIIVKATKTDTTTDPFADYLGGFNSLWTMDESNDPDYYIDVDADMDQFSTLLSNCSYEIIRETADGIVVDYTCDDYLSSMRYIYPECATINGGWALNYATDAAYYSFVTIILYSPSQRRYFLVPTGTNGNSHEHLMFYLLDNRYLLVRGNYVYQYTFDLKHYGDDLEFYSLGFNGGGDSSINDKYTIALKPTNVGCANFILDSFTGASIIPYTYMPLANYEYEFDIMSNSMGCVFSTYGYTQSYPLEIVMQYAKYHSGLMALGRNIPVNQEKLDKELDIKIKRALFDLISTGTGDPDASTPGRLYFKYLE